MNVDSMGMYQMEIVYSFYLKHGLEYVRSGTTTIYPTMDCMERIYLEGERMTRYMRLKEECFLAVKEKLKTQLLTYYILYGDTTISIYDIKKIDKEYKFKAMHSGIFFTYEFISFRYKFTEEALKLIHEID